MDGIPNIHTHHKSLELVFVYDMNILLNSGSGRGCWVLLK